MSNKMYFWVDGELKCTEYYSLRELPDEYREYHCVDTSNTVARRRYGMYLDDDWIPLHFAKFPKQFKLILLTLGVT